MACVDGDDQRISEQQRGRDIGRRLEARWRADGSDIELAPLSAVLRLADAMFCRNTRISGYLVLDECIRLGKILASVRIVVSVSFMKHSRQKLFGFPPTLRRFLRLAEACYF